MTTFQLHPMLEKDVSPRPGLWYAVGAHEGDKDGPTPEPRVGASAVQMKETGRVLLYAGANPEKAFSDVHILIIDSNTISWKKLPSFSPPHHPPPRYEHTLVFGPDAGSGGGGVFFVFAGAQQSGPLGDLWSFTLDGDDGEWREIGEGVRMGDPPPSPRTHHSSSCVWRKKKKMIIFSGGDCGTNTQDNSLHTFDMETYKWKKEETRGAPPTPRQGHVIAIVKDVLYVHGGMTSGGKISSDFFSLSLDTMTWSKPELAGEGTVAPALAAHGSAVIEERLFIFGGLSDVGPSDTLHCFNTERVWWSVIEIEGAPPPARLDFAMTTVRLQLPSPRTASNDFFSPPSPPLPAKSATLSSSASHLSPPPPPPSSTLCQPNLVTVLAAEDCTETEPSSNNPAVAVCSVDDKKSVVMSSENKETDTGVKKFAENELKFAKSEANCTSNEESHNSDAAKTVDKEKEEEMGLMTALLVYGGMDTSGNIHSDCFIFVPLKS